MKILDELVEKACVEEVASEISISLLSKNGIVSSGSNKIFDIASLTKVVTALEFIKLYRMGKIDLDENVSTYLEEYAHGTKVYNLLQHTSGITDESVDVENWMTCINKKKLENTNIFYADYNFILLGEILKRKFSIHLLESENIYFKPTKQVEKECIVKTENRPDRGQVHGEVHDNKCYLLGQESGHAGLFSNSKYFTEYIAEFFKDEENIKILQKYCVGKRTLGFIVNDDEKMQMGKFSNKALFHTGFAGTSVLVCDKGNLIVTIFTNRIYPSRENVRIFDFRKECHDRIFEEVIKDESCDFMSW